MKKTLLAAAAASALLAGLAAGAFANETSVAMRAMGAKGAHEVIGQARISETADGLSIALDLNELPPGPNQLFLYETATCTFGDSKLPSQLIQALSVDHDEDGSLPLKTSFHVAGMTLEQMTGKALVIERGDQLASQALPLTGQPRHAACGIVE